jgi:small subunit ribosomal protein S8
MRMSVGNYPVGDFLMRIKNASMAKKKSVEFPSTKFVAAVAKALVKEGYLEAIEQKERILAATLSFRKKEPMVSDIKLISKPGLRIYKKLKDLEAKRGPSIFILSTPKGIMSSKEAVKKSLGGEVIAEIL